MEVFVQDDGVDPLDAFMAAEINPEVKAKEAEEVQRKEEERKVLAKQMAVRIIQISLLPSSTANLPSLESLKYVAVHVLPVAFASVVKVSAWCVKGVEN